MECMVSFNLTENNYYYFKDRPHRKNLADFLDKKGITFKYEFKKVLMSDGKEREEDENQDFFHANHLFDITELAAHQIKFSVVDYDEADTKNSYLHKISKSLEKIQGKEIVHQNPVININYEHSQDAFLHKVTKVEICEDFCTNELQEKLNDGWRIVAVCYQKGNRRPDYVVGKVSES